MSWEYNVKEHKFYLDGVYQFDADYAGASGYKNDPSQECVKNSGLLPRGNTQLVPLIILPTQENIPSASRPTRQMICVAETHLKFMAKAVCTLMTLQTAALLLL